jgi:hypothetical protein
VTCDRCYKESLASIMSKFNNDRICMECKKKEREHPKYKEADEAECAAVRRGERNFPGIGKPADL